jgi:hypothetical protein
MKLHWLIFYASLKIRLGIKYSQAIFLQSIIDDKNLLVSLTPGFVAKEKTLEKLNWIKKFGINGNDNYWTRPEILANLFPKHQ